MSVEPPPKKSPVPISVQLGPGLGLTAPPPITVFPSISHIEACPLLVFCQTMSGSSVKVRLALGETSPGPQD